MNGIERLQKIVDRYENLVFFGGAGVSTESGIPDFRSVDGLYHQKYDYPPETILSHTFFMRNPEEFYRFYHDKCWPWTRSPTPPTGSWPSLRGGKAPGGGHAEHRRAASGGRKQKRAGASRSVHRNYCMKCHEFYDAEYMAAAEGIPRCEKCGGIIKPDVVLYEEGLDQRLWSGGFRHFPRAGADLGGTSLVVYPAAGLLRYFGGDARSDQ